MTDNTMLSVVIPVYNAESYLERCVASILHQTDIRLELLLVDDGSTDKSPEMCDSFSKVDKRVRVFHIPNGGPSIARNHGMKAARGKYISFVDADDYLESGVYSAMIGEMQQHNADMAVCRWVTHNVDTGSEVISNIGASGLVNAKEVAQRIFTGDELYGGGFPWNRVIDLEKLRKKQSNEILFPESIRVYEDKCFVMDCLSCMDGVLMMDTIGYHYQIHQGSLTRRSMASKMLDVAKAFEYCYQTLERMDCITPEIEISYRENLTSYLVRLHGVDQEAGEAMWRMHLSHHLRWRCWTMKYCLKYLFLCYRYRKRRYGI